MMTMERISNPLGGRLLGCLVALGLVVGSLLAGSSRAEQVDSEIVLLVDASVFVSSGNLRDTLESFAQTFESPSMISTMQSGTIGKIAASVVLFSGPGVQAVTVPWMGISDAASAQAFAAAVRASSRPFVNTTLTSSFVGALNFATPHFGSETSGPANGFESHSQVINMTSESFLFPAEGAAAVQAASNQAILSGVDVINAMVVGTFNSTGAVNYYSNNIVGGSAGGVPGAVASAPNYGALPAAALLSLNTQVAAAIPEPGSLFLLPLAAGLVILRRRT